MMAIGVSLPLLVLYSLLVSAVLMWLNLRGTSAAAAAEVTLAVCVVMALLQVFASRPTLPSRQGIQLWLGFVLLPTAAVFGVSRLGLLNTRPWLLLLIGPISFVTALVIFGTILNILFSTRNFDARERRSR